MELEEGEPPLVALTFDDGPRNSTTGRLLDGLALQMCIRDSPRAALIYDPEDFPSSPFGGRARNTVPSAGSTCRSSISCSTVTKQ